ncbi:MAG: hypothetical protein U9N51_07670 [Bacteroidota bacterium]|nr:hypothetical protein [Bacteroidota bacterium]
MEAKADGMKADIKSEYLDKLSALKESRKDLQCKFDKLKNSTDEKWEETKNAFSSASDSFKEGFSDLFSMFK